MLIYIYIYICSDGTSTHSQTRICTVSVRYIMSQSCCDSDDKSVGTSDLCQHLNNKHQNKLSANMNAVHECCT